MSIGLRTRFFKQRVNLAAVEEDASVDPQRCENAALVEVTDGLFGATEVFSGFAHAQQIRDRRRAAL